MTAVAHLFGYQPEGAPPLVVGMWKPPGWPRPGDAGVAHLTEDRATAESWRRDLAAGRLPELGAQEPAGREWGRATSSAAAG